MADLIKGGARKPRILKGTCFTGNNYDSTTSHERGVMPGMCYDLTVQSAALVDGVSYTARLTETEMLHVMQEWLTRYNQHHDQNRREAAKARAASRGEHDQHDSPLRSRS